MARRRSGARCRLLALDDAALCRLLIGAGAVPYERRDTWLRSVAARFEARQPSANAVRQKRFRERQRNGQISLRIAVSRDAIVERVDRRWRMGERFCGR